MTESSQSAGASSVAIASRQTSSRWTLARVTIGVTVALVGFILILFIVGLLMAFGDPEVWALRVQIIRDLVLVILTVQGILIFVSVAILFIQLARFFNLIRSEIRPIADDTKEAVQTIRKTTQFVGKNAAEPLIVSKSFFAGLWVFLREMLAIRRLLRRNKPPATGRQNLSED